MLAPFAPSSRKSRVRGQLEVLHAMIRMDLRDERLAARLDVDAPAGMEDAGVVNRIPRPPRGRCSLGLNLGPGQVASGCTGLLYSGDHCHLPAFLAEVLGRSIETQLLAGGAPRLVPLHRARAKRP